VEDVGGQKIHTFAGKSLPWRADLHAGRSGAVMVLGLDR
jgi:hypothetical protein